MSRRLTRKQIKRDQVGETLGSGIEYVLVHWKSIAYALLAVAAAFGVAAGVRSHQLRREVRAGEELAEAVKVLQAAIDPETADPADPEERTFPDEAAREARAMELFDRVQREFSSTDAAAIASVYRARLVARRGDHEEARALWEEFVDRQGDHMLASEVRLNLMTLARQQGRGEELAAEIRSMLDSGRPPLPPDVLLFELGQTLESLGDAGAGAVYGRLVDEFPDSPYAPEARRRTDVRGAPDLGPA